MTLPPRSPTDRICPWRSNETAERRSERLIAAGSGSPSCDMAIMLRGSTTSMERRCMGAGDISVMIVSETMAGPRFGLRMLAALASDERRMVRLVGDLKTRC